MSKLAVAGLLAAAVVLTALAAAPRIAPEAGAPRAATSLTPAQLAGQRVIFSYHGTTPPASLLRLIREGRAAGVVFFGENITGHAQLRAVIAKLQQADAASSNPVRAPLLLMTDQEGGAVRRLSGAPHLSEKQIGSAADPQAAARAAGRGAAHNLAGVGVNVNLAPVLDVYRSAGDFIDQYGRSYSSDPEVVATLGGDFITAQQQNGVAATAKHFPGLGSARAGEDTDQRPVVLSVPLGSLRSIDELPYRAAIAAGVRLVMVSWATYPALDAGRPAGLSPIVVRHELRDRLGFSGVTITDALEAGALAPVGDTSRRSIKAALAGMDLLLCSARRVSQGEHAAAALEAGYLHGELPKADFKAAVERVDALRRSMGN